MPNVSTWTPHSSPRCHHHHHHCLFFSKTSRAAANCYNFPFTSFPSRQRPLPQSLYISRIKLPDPLMRVPAFSSIIRTFAAFTNATSRLHPLAHRTLAPPSNTLILRSMPTIPFLSSLFGTSTPASAKMSYPDQRSDDEWHAVLNKGSSMNPPLALMSF
jgi:hypothetical protein